MVELAGVKFSMGIDTVETFQSLINPERTIPREVIPVHGITDEMVADAPIAKTVLTQFSDFCGTDTILVAHNAPFDMSFLGHELQRAGLPLGSNLILDSCDIARRIFPGLYSYSLLSLAQHFQIAATQDHRALGDALLVGSLLATFQSKFPKIEKEDDFAVHFMSYRMSAWKSSAVELPDKYSDISLAIKEKLEIEIIYQSQASGKAAYARTIIPLRAFEKGVHLYLNAFCLSTQAERTFRFDRITSFRLLTKA